MNALASGLLAWLLTYAIHSTIILGIAWLITRRLRQRPDLASTIWRTALIGGLVTATLQVGLGVGAVSGSVHLGENSRSVVAVPAGEEVRASLALGERPWISSSAVVTEEIPVRSPMDQREASLGHIESPAEPPPTRYPAWLNWLLAVWGIGASLGGLILIGAMVGLGRRLRGWRPLRSGPLARIVSALGRRAGVRRGITLGVAPQLRVPMAFGTIAPSIYVPHRVLTDLDAAEQETLIAHEVAHIARHDPAWRLVGLAIERVFFFQPLNRIANRELATSAELLCDEWAAASTKRPLALAQCLAEVAGWVVGSDRLAPAPTMAGRPSELARRIERLVEDCPRPGRKRGAMPVLLGSGALVLAAILAPGVSSGATPPQPLAHVGMGSSLITACDRETSYSRVMVSDGGDVVIVASGGADPEVVVAPSEAKETKKSAKKKRRKAKKKMRQAFRDARRRGDVTPTDREIYEALGRSPKAKRARKPKPVKLRSGDTTVLIYENADGSVKVVGRSQSSGHHAEVDVQAYADAVRRRAGKQSRKSKAEAMKRHEDARRRHRETMKRAEETRRRALKTYEKQLRRQQRELEERERQLERELRRRGHTFSKPARPAKPAKPAKPSRRARELAF